MTALSTFLEIVFCINLIQSLSDNLLPNEMIKFNKVLVNAKIAKDNSSIENGKLFKWFEIVNYSCLNHDILKIIFC